MGRVNNVGGGYGCVPKGYYLRLAADGICSMCASTAPRGKDNDSGIRLARKSRQLRRRPMAQPKAPILRK